MSPPNFIPAGFNLLAEAVGEELAVEICLEYGGGRLYVPRDPADTILERLVGSEAARKIVDVAAGDRIEIPLSARVLSAALRSRGWTQERRAKRLRCARRTIQRWDAGEECKFPQPDLFA